MAQHARVKVDAGIQVYFCDPHSPWQRGTNENTNGLAAVAAVLNARPRKTLAWQSPAEVLDQLIMSAMSSDARN